MKSLKIVSIVIICEIILFCSIELYLRVRGYNKLQRSKHQNWMKIEDRVRSGEYKISDNIVLGWEKAEDVYASISAKQDNTYRIMVLGDSITEAGYYVDHLQKLFDASESSVDYEILNCAVAGYGIYQYNELLKSKIFRYHPDMVIVGFCLNDLMAIPVVFKDSQGDFFWAQYNLSPVKIKINSYLFKKSYFYRFIISKIYSDILVNKAVEQEEYKIGFFGLKSILEKMANEKIAFLPVIIPYLKSDYNKDEQEEYAAFLKIFTKFQLNYLDLHGQFLDIDDKSWREAERDQIHPSKKGHQLIAEKIYEYLNSRKK